MTQIKPTFHWIFPSLSIWEIDAGAHPISCFEARHRSNRDNLIADSGTQARLVSFPPGGLTGAVSPIGSPPRAGDIHRYELNCSFGRYIRSADETVIDRRLWDQEFDYFCGGTLICGQTQINILGERSACPDPAVRRCYAADGKAKAARARLAYATVKKGNNLMVIISRTHAGRATAMR